LITDGDNKEATMKRLFLALVVSALAFGPALSPALAQDTCESKAVSKDGKALAGAAKASFVKKCKKDACEAKAVSSEGKKLAGAAKKSFMAKCQLGA
jgi:hypothetical protein